MALLFSLLALIIASVVIMYACNSFDDSASYLGRNMQPGVKGATINAIGSSLPELMTALFLLFLFQDQDGFSAGIATTAGSAVFNSVIIPMLCIFAVAYRGTLKKVVGPDGKMRMVREKIQSFNISRNTIVRDGFFLLVAEGALIWFLGGTTMAWWMGAAMMFIYVLYFLYLSRGFSGGDWEAHESEDEDDDEEPAPSKLKALITFDFNNLIFDGKDFTTQSAWIVLSCATAVIGVACYVLAEVVIISADLLGVPAYFTAVIFAAAATSVPDTVLSVKDAVKGEYDDAIANALGSNTFDITVALGLPLLLYGLLYGDVMLSSAGDETNASVQALRIVLFGVTVAVLSCFLISKSITVKTAYFLGAIYTGWLAFLFADVMGWI
ncbi:tRNA pseudouridine synthase A [Oleiphilus messinensis]|uniref:tRNA pseudouridine synthase A n=1 Tax=Oleiphilus messinensis TaxID=141451 RepID=A0A1Y0I8L6_9GAMM|nr:hypothetical protein [Oleiphilus messinensis]ARU56116.1 tRNA pseudouridine synthase A [Oleiphilus messinensis]